MISMRVRGLKKAEKTVVQMAARVGDLTPVFRVAAQQIEVLTQRAFAEQRSPDGRPWKPFSEGTLRQNAGRMLLTPASLQLSVQAAVGRASLKITAVSPYAIFFHGGTKGATGKRHMPARPFMPFTKRGGFMRRGPAGEFLKWFLNALRDHVIRGGMTPPTIG